MTQPTSLNEYKQEIRAVYDARTNYDNDFTYRRAIPLVELAQLQPGQQVLDIATGTAIVAIAAAEKVGSKGKVIGVDFSTSMLKQARRKIAATGLQNIELIEADAETITFEDEQFDAIFCATAIVLLSDIPAALRNWHRWLKSGGIVAFSCWSTTSFFTPVIMKVCAKYGFELPNLHELLGSPEKCYTFLQEIGFKNIDIKTEQFGSYLSLDDAKNYWKGTWLCSNGHPLLHLPNEQIEQLKAEFKAEVEKLATYQGIWHDITTFFVIGRK
ncbi:MULTISPECIES: class I SAM-dependent methyltransferase [unclassified Coleofasciculus]|uniref:class I SAM-dependent methyltransferase n=1 Tax=unclassified Coleofasciculus TaxID=2692782 RepID=UPI00187E9584|nr:MULTISPECIES: class I SAM-dependent methyltransferase [unclassified Coleofasciculus]MBE9127683.1 class I SAM-dependent methyltransferase [Coleofasciculus sp. LEGE 07081]MBE9151021.1 class I SAM-dependent methyltransferase [Coleofasciculus sp. LEGE 07092]